ncbi:class I SAM-dependent methyltransferase [Haloarcula marismortui]|uniref:class I SAM-dependent methyltransferase n=1 Tax=Haloarcula marismortui TaxID=2238 RepID=UPI003C766299
MTKSFQRYLRAKRTVDDRALDRRLVKLLREQLADRATDSDGPLRILEIGAGIGTMLARFLDWDVLPAGEVHYTAVDLQSENVARLPDHIRNWAADRQMSVRHGPLVLDSENRRVEIEAVQADAVAHATGTDGEYDLLVGAALLDILDRRELPTLLDPLAPGGLYYFPLTFDGATRFQPSHPADRTVERLYHEHMDGKQGGDSRAGSDVLGRLQRLDGTTLSAVAGSDWVVRPIDGSYPADEAYFLRYILDTIEDAVGEVAGRDFEGLADWLAGRREQVAAAELLYHAHQLDFLGRAVTRRSSGESWPSPRMK